MQLYAWKWKKSLICSLLSKPLFPTSSLFQLAFYPPKSAACNAWEMSIECYFLLIEMNCIFFFCCCIFGGWVFALACAHVEVTQVTSGDPYWAWWTFGEVAQYSLPSPPAPDTGLPSKYFSLLLSVDSLAKQWWHHQRILFRTLLAGSSTLTLCF